VEARGQAGSARVGHARAVTPAPSSPSPAATAWRSCARLSDDRLGALLATAEARAIDKHRRGVGRRLERARQLDDLRAQ